MNTTSDYETPTEGREEGDGKQHPSAKDRHVVDRRSTLGLLAALGGAGVFASRGAAEEEDTEGDDDDNGVSVESDQPVGTEALLQLIVAEYGEMLTDEQISQLEDDVASNREAANELRAFDLANGDDMAITFRAYRGSY